MNEYQVDELLQECLAAYEAGLTPEECLAAWPEQRVILEPLLRQAMCLRFAFASSPREEFQKRLHEKLMFLAGREASESFAAAPRAEFRQRLHEKLMFVAGREASRAFSTKPDPSFVARARNRLRFAAGAAAQEALRAVPPPRLAFWINARRRLLEAAANSARQASPRPVAFAMRTGLSMAVLGLALTLAGVLYLTSQSHPRTASAELASIDQQSREIAQQYAAGLPIQPDTLVNLSGRTLTLAGKVQTDQNLAPLADKLQQVIDRQQEVVNRVAAESPTRPPALQEVQQQLSQAEQQVRIAAARVDLPTAPAQQATLAPAATLQPSPATPPTATPVTPPLGSANPIGFSQVRFAILPGDTTFGLSWAELSTANFRAIIPAGWTFVGLSLNAQGVAILQSPRIRLDGPSGVIVLIDTSSGQVDDLVNGQALNLREKGVTAKTISVTDLVAKAGSAAPELSHLVESVVLVIPAPTSTPTAVPSAVSTSTATATSIPPATTTPLPSPTP